MSIFQKNVELAISKSEPEVRIWEYEASRSWDGGFDNLKSVLESNGYQLEYTGGKYGPRMWKATKP